MIFLDTDILSYLLAEDVFVRNKVAENIKNGEQICLTSINVYEILKGLKYKNNERKEIRFNEFLTKLIILPLDDDAISEASAIYADLRKRGIVIGDADIMIAAIVIINNGILVSNNEKHYQNITKLQLINWL
jgi:predicted nucleic acid-binding protein